MQLALTPEMLFPLVAGAAVVVAVIALVVVLGHGRRSPAVRPVRAAAAGLTAADLTAADWTGEAATGDPASAVVDKVASVAPHRLTVAEAVAVRAAVTAPLPVISPMLPEGGPAMPVPDPAVAGTASAPARVQQAGSPPVPAWPSADPEVAPVAEAAAPGSGLGESAVPEPVIADSSAASEERVEQRSAEPTPADGAAPAGDVRDRLLAVLLDDPERAKDAATELDAHRGQVGEVLCRLAASGLKVDQLARLAGFPPDEVRSMIGQQDSAG